MLLSYRRHFLNSYWVLVTLEIINIELESTAHHRKGQFIPGDFIQAEQTGITAFFAHAVFAVFQFAEEEHVDLVDMGQIENGIKVTNGHRGAGFFPGFAGRAFLQGFPVFHIAGGQGPVALAWFDRAFTQQHFAFPHGDCADHDLGILVVDGLAIGAPVAGPVVSFRNAETDLVATAVTAEFHVLDQLRQRLPDYKRTELPLALPEAAVLMPLIDDPEPRLILTVRSSTMPTHAGEVAFPGGKRDPGDKNLLMTALRESQEEVGLDPGYVDVLGQLSPLASRYGMKVTPFVGIVRPEAPLVAEPGEIETIFQVPLQFFLDEVPELSSPIDFFGRRFRIPSYYYEDKRIWGLTAFMILDLINHVYDANIEFEVTD